MINQSPDGMTDAAPIAVTGYLEQNDQAEVFALKYSDAFDSPAVSASKEARSYALASTTQQAETVISNHPGGVLNVASHLTSGIADQAVNHTGELLVNGAVGTAFGGAITVGLEVAKKPTIAVLALGGVYMLTELWKAAPKWAGDISVAYAPRSHTQSEVANAEKGLHELGRGTANFAANSIGSIPGSMLGSKFLATDIGAKLIARFNPTKALEEVTNKSAFYASVRADDEIPVESLSAKKELTPEPVETVAKKSDDAASKRAAKEQEIAGAKAMDLAASMPDSALEPFVARARVTTDADGNKYFTMFDDSNPSARAILVRDKDNNVKGLLVRGGFDDATQKEVWMAYQDGKGSPWVGEPGVQSNEIQLITSASKPDHPFQKQMPESDPVYQEFIESGGTPQLIMESTQKLLSKMARIADEKPDLVPETFLSKKPNEEVMFKADLKNSSHPPSSPEGRFAQAFEHTRPEELRRILVDKAKERADGLQHFHKVTENVQFATDPKGRKISSVTADGAKIVLIQDKDGNPLLYGVGRKAPSGMYEEYSFKIGDRYTNWVGEFAKDDNMAALSTDLDRRFHPLNQFEPKLRDRQMIAALESTEPQHVSELTNVWKAKDVLDNLNLVHPAYSDSKGGLAIQGTVGNEKGKLSLAFFDKPGDFRGSIIRTDFDKDTGIAHWVAVDRNLKPRNTWETNGDTKSLEKWMGENITNNRHPLSDRWELYKDTASTDETVPEVFRSVS